MFSVLQGHPKADISKALWHFAKQAFALLRETAWPVLHVWVGASVYVVFSFSVRLNDTRMLGFN